ncbi:MAG: xanthine dehydrogenase family protein molybdopterin-binding subunit, partial [Chloroflexota bacterium]
MLHARIVRSPHAHARIRGVNAVAALSLPGVWAVLTHADLPPIRHSTAGQPWPETSPYDARVLDEKVRYVGDWVAFVAAETPELAEQAAELVEVDYEVLPAVFDLAEATRPGAPRLHEIDPHPQPEVGGIYDASRNLAAHGEIAVDGEYEVPFVQHCALEPHVTLAWLDGFDRLNVVSSTQVPFHTRRQLALALDLPIKRVRVIKPRVGGGFGGKQEMLTEPVAAALALRTRRPVRIELSRAEEFAASRVRHAMRIRMRGGVDRDGQLRALEMRAASNTGAYGTHGNSVTGNAGKKSLCLYRADAYRFVGDTIYTNLPVAGAMRGYGAPQGYFALECHMDEMAHRLGIDPLTFRLRNAIRKGDEDRINHRTVRSCGLVECADRAADAFGWWARQPVREGAVRRGYGVAMAMQGSGVAGAELGGATIKLNEDGSFNLLTGATDIGQGSDTVLAQIAAQTLGVSPDDIVMYSADTDITVFDYGSYASSTTYVTGSGVKLAAEETRRQILAVAADMLAMPPQELDVQAGVIFGPDGPTRLTLRDIGHETLYGAHRQQILGKGDFHTDDSPPPFAVQMAEIEVDVETGRIRVRRLCSAVDLGRAINPTLAAGQIEGAVAMALGYALSEAILLDDRGRVRNASFVDYKVLSTLDMPEMITLLIEDPEPTGPYGAKSAGEVPVNGPAPAVANALFDACGVRVRSLPLTPEKVLAALDEAGRRTTEEG